MKTKQKMKNLKKVVKKLEKNQKIVNNRIRLIKEQKSESMH